MNCALKVCDTCLGRWINRETAGIPDITAKLASQNSCSNCLIRCSISLWYKEPRKNFYIGTTNRRTDGRADRQFYRYAFLTDASISGLNPRFETQIFASKSCHWKTRPNTRLPQSPAVGQEPYLRSVDHFGRSTNQPTHRQTVKQTGRQTDRQTDRQKDR